MTNMPSIQSRIDNVPPSQPILAELPRPSYRDSGKQSRAFLGIEIFKRHMTSEGWQLQVGLRDFGAYRLCGSKLGFDCTDTAAIMRQIDPGTVIVQDKREWDRKSDICWDPDAHFENIQVLKEMDDVFKLTILKDAQHNTAYHRESADEIGCHAWITYYHPRIVKHFARYVRERDIIRTYHSIDPNDVPAFGTENRVRRAIVSGAVCADAYPLRYRLHRNSMHLPMMTVHCHPGYRPKGHATARYLKTLSEYCVSICTASKFGYALRKIIESTACGCAVVTDLPVDDVLPEIDGNLIRISPDITNQEMYDVLMHQIKTYDEERQRHYAAAAIDFYDYRKICARLADDIESARKAYR